MKRRPSKKNKSIRLFITQGTVLFTLLLSITFSVVCFFLFQRYASSSVLRAAEFNLQLVTNLVKQDLVELNGIARQSALDGTIMSYLNSETPTKRAALDAYEKIRTRFTTCHAYAYLERLLVTNGQDRMVQAVSNHTYDIPLSLYNLPQLPFIDSSEARVWADVVLDPFITMKHYQGCLLVVHPVLATPSHQRVGTVYLTASTHLITDRLQNYEMAPGSILYFTTPAGSWRIEDGAFVPEQPVYTPLGTDTITARSNETHIETVRTDTGEKLVCVTLPVGTANLYLTHCIPQSQLFTGHSLLWGMIVFMSVVVMALGFVLSHYLGRVIMGPVDQLTQRVEQIAGGDFSYDEAIEFESELGTVGRGINKLSHDVDSLMQRRLADEQARQQLEYKMLQNQINPHFIYNTLNSIKWMASIQGATGIAEMTTAFAHLLKSVSKGNRPLIPLREEFALLNDYCTIQQYRYGGAITIEIADITDEDLCNGLIPSFTLQPLAENAIFHGIEPKDGAGSVLLHISQDAAGDVHITMQDDGLGMSQQTIDRIFAGEQPGDEKKKFQQIGIWNVHRRIQYAFGPQYGLSIRSEIGKYTCIEIVIPFITELPGGQPQGGAPA